MTKENIAESSTKPVPLHPAYSVSNIQSKIRILDGSKVTYSAWVKLFRLHAVAYKVENHIDDSPPPAATSPEYDQWKELDALVLQWIYSTVSDDLLKRLMDTTVARAAWTKLEKIYLSNKKARAAALETRFCNLTLTACSSVEDYCQQLSDLANQLADVDQPVSDSRLVLQLVRGLPAEYNTTASLINQQGVDWDQAIAMLNDEVIRIEAQKGHSNTVLAATSAPPPDSSSANPNQQPDASYSSSSNLRGTRGRGGASNRRGRGRGRPQQRNPWSVYPGQSNTYPNWACWTPPPCPYPTQSNQQQWSSNNQQLSAPQVQYTGFSPVTGFSPASYAPPGFSPPVYNPLCPTDLSAAMANMQVNSSNMGWTSDVMDTGAESHVTKDKGKIIIPDSIPVCRNILVGNGMYLPINGSGTGFHPLPNRTYILPHILYSPQIIKNLISVRRFTRDNQVSVEFDPFGFSLKDLKTKRTLSRHNSTGTLYTFTPPQLPPQATFIASHNLPWHDRLGHPGAQVLDILNRNLNFQCNMDKSQTLCNSCQLSNSKRLPFYLSNTFTFAPFDIIHCDLWTSPITSKTGYKYYMVLIDNFSHFVWVYPLKYKSETFPTFTKFHQLILTQFHRKIKTFQCDLGGEFDNLAFKTFAQQNRMLFRFSCPQNSSQNGRAERMIRRLNDIIRALLIHANLPPSFWVEALHTATYLHNILPTKRLNFYTPTFALYLRHPDYEHLRVFGCACYPNTSATQPHKLHHRSMRCIFLGYPPDFRGYRCLDPATGKVRISRHVTFDEHVFPFTHPHHPTQYTFLDDATPPGFTFHRPINHPVQNPVTAPYPITYSRRPRPAQTSIHPAGPLNPPATVPVPTPSPAQAQTQPTPTTASAQPTQPTPSMTNQHPMTTRSKS